MNEEGELLYVHAAENYPGLQVYIPAIRRRQKKANRNKPREVPSPRPYMKTLLKAAAEGNDELIRRGLPFRFCIHEDRGRILIDVVRLNEQGRPIAAVQRDITEKDFRRCIEDVAKLEGLIVDETA